MTRIEIDGLRLQFEAACDVYYTQACKLIDQAKGGQQPLEDNLHAEALALDLLNKARRSLLDALERVSTRH
jgi:hypothetical protein